MARLVPTGRGAEVVSIGPATCPNGHPLRYPNVLIGHRGCVCVSGGHRSYECLTCEAVIYDPPHDGSPWRQGSAYDAASP